MEASGCWGNCRSPVRTPSRVSVVWRDRCRTRHPYPTHRIIGAARRYLPGASSDAEREAALFTMLFAGPLLWMLLGWLVALAGRRAGLAAAVLLMHYASALALVATTGLGLRGLAKEIPDFVLVWAPAYLLGQVGLWWRIVRGAEAKPSADL